MKNYLRFNILQTKHGIMLTHVITTYFSTWECDLKWCHNLIRFNLLFQLNKVTRNAYVVFFYYLNIISISKPICVYIFWKVWSNVIFESWNNSKTLMVEFWKMFECRKSSALLFLAMLIYRFKCFESNRLGLSISVPS